MQKPSKLQREAGVALLVTFLRDTFAHRQSAATGLVSSMQLRALLKMGRVSV